MARSPRRPDSTSSASSSVSTASSSSSDGAELHRHYHLHTSAAALSMTILPARQPVASHADISRTLKFSIENILRPDFGRVNRCRDATPVNSKIKKRHPHQNRSRNEITVINETTSVVHAANERCETASVKLVSGEVNDGEEQRPEILWPAWVYCTRYSDRPSSGRSPRSRGMKKRDKNAEDKRPRTAFTNDQLHRLKREFSENRYLTEKRRQDLARDLKLSESQIKIWFQNKRAKIKKTTGQRNCLAIHLMAQGLYNHSILRDSPPPPLKEDPMDKGRCDDDHDDDDKCVR